MTADIVIGQLRIQARAERGIDQYIADVKLNGARRTRTLIARVVLDDDDRRTWGNKGPGRMAGGWHVARRVGRRRLAMLAYATSSGLPVAPQLAGAPAYAWWPKMEPQNA